MTVLIGDLLDLAGDLIDLAGELAVFLGETIIFSDFIVMHFLIHSKYLYCILTHSYKAYHSSILQR